MNSKLAKTQQQVKLFYGEAKNVIKRILNTFPVDSVFSYQESGIMKSWDRDKAIKVLLEKCGVAWKECQRDGIIRGIENRGDGGSSVKRGVRGCCNCFLALQAIQYTGAFPGECRQAPGDDALRQPGCSNTFERVYEHTFFDGTLITDQSV